MSETDGGPLHDYVVEAVVVTTAVGTVHRGHHRITGQPVRLLHLAPGIAAAPQMAERLGGAARAAATVHHPGIVATYDVLVEGGDTWVVSEPVVGATLRDLAPPGTPLPPATAMVAIDGVLGALEAAHQRGVVHGMVGPEWVVATPEGQARLDGLVLCPALVGAGLAAPTPGYAPPERLSGGHADTAADLYAAAALAHALLVGVPGSLDVNAVLPSLPAIAQVLARAMGAEASTRYASATELRGALIGASVTALGPAWRLGSDLPERVTALGIARPEPPAPGPGVPAPAAPTPAAAAGPPVALPVPPPPSSAVAATGAAPAPLAPLPPPSTSYLPAPARRAAVEEPVAPPKRGRRVPIWLWVLIVLAILCVAGAGVTLAVKQGGSNSGPLSVGAVDPLAVHLDRQANCTNVYTITATGKVSGAGTLVFHWERSDGFRGDDQRSTITSNDASFEYTTQWSIQGVHGDSETRTVTFVITSPTTRKISTNPPDITPSC